jgi:hypothetical protein
MNSRDCADGPSPRSADAQHEPAITIALRAPRVESGGLLARCSCPPRWGDVYYGDGYRVPSPGACDVEHERYFHDDLAALGAIAVRVELRAIEATLATSGGRNVLAREWLAARHDVLRAHLRRGTPVAADRRDAPPPRRVRVVVA